MLCLDIECCKRNSKEHTGIDIILPKILEV